MGTIGLGHKTMNGFAVGDLVEVKPVEEILATLDDRGELESLPFMPEMLEYCGKQFVIDKISHKTCDTFDVMGIHKMENTVHLTGLRCDGAAHGGCQAGCLIFWKTDWLTPASAIGSKGHPEPARADALTTRRLLPMADVGTPGGCTRERLTEVAVGADRLDDDDDPAAGPRYSCQATELPRAMGDFVPRWNLRQYVDDVQYGNASLRSVLKGIGVGLFNLVQTFSTKVLPRRLRFKGGVRYPFIVPSAERTPVATLGLQPGDWVRVRSAEEIGPTLDKDHRNRGLYFDREMLLYCGRTLQVLRRVDHIIDENTGRMISMKTPCVILSGGYCTAAFHRSCPRAIYSYWREIWLERVPAPVPPLEVAQTPATQDRTVRA